MRALGIVLLVFNLLAAGGFGYLAFQDYKGRQTITAGAVRNLLVLTGLPLESGADNDKLPSRVPQGSEGYNDYATTEVPFRLELAGSVPTPTISPEILYQYFEAADPAKVTGEDAKTRADFTVGYLNNQEVKVGPLKALGTKEPVPSQMAEVRRVQALIRQHLSTVTDARAKTDLLGGWLIYQPETYGERVEILRLIQNTSAEDLERKLFDRFERVLNPKAPTTGTGEKPTYDPVGAVRDDHDKRVRLAHLLIHLDTDANWQKRVLMVVGARRYAPTAFAQAVRFKDMAGRVNDQIDMDNRAFEAQYAQADSLSRDRVDAITRALREREVLDRQRGRARAQVAEVETRLAGTGANDPGLRVLLQRVKAEVDGMIAQQTAIERRLFAVQREVGLTLEQIYQLEAELEQLEKQRFGKK